MVTENCVCLEVLHGYKAAIRVCIMSSDVCTHVLQATFSVGRLCETCGEWSSALIAACALFDVRWNFFAV